MKEPAVAQQSGMKSDKKKKYEDYEVKDAFDTLSKAEEIKSNPELMAHVKKHADKKAGHIKSIQDLKDARHKLVHEKESEKAEDPKEEKSESKADEDKEMD